MTELDIEKTFFDLSITSTEARNAVRYIERLFADEFDTILVSKHKKASYVILSPEKYVSLLRGETSIKFRSSAQRAEAIDELEVFLDATRDTLLDAAALSSVKNRHLVGEPGFRSL